MFKKVNRKQNRVISHRTLTRNSEEDDKNVGEEELDVEEDVFHEETPKIVTNVNNLSLNYLDEGDSKETFVSKKKRPFCRGKIIKFRDIEESMPSQENPESSNRDEQSQPVNIPIDVIPLESISFGNTDLSASHGSIPDSNCIYAARMQREAAQQMGEMRRDINASKVPNYIPVDSNSDEEVYGSKRIEMSVQNEKEEQPSIDDDSQQYQDSSDEDAMERWELEQIRKGVGIPANFNDSSSRNSLSTMSTLRAYMPDVPEDASPRNHFSHSYAPNPDDKSLSVNQSNLIDFLLSKMETHCEFLESKIKDNYETIQNLENDAKLVGDASEAANKLRLKSIDLHVLLQQINGYTLDYVDCWNEKILGLNQIYTEIRDIIRNAMEENFQKRCQKLELIRSQILSSFSSDSNNLSENSNNAKTGFIFEESLMEDEFESSQLCLKIEQILNENQSHLSDIDDNFTNIDAVMALFDKWISDHPASFFASMSHSNFHRLLHPLILLNILSWKPLLSDKPLLEYLSESTWFSSLLVFGQSKSGVFSKDVNEKRNSEFSDILPLNVFQFSVISIIADYVEVWDVFSCLQTKNLTDILRVFVINNPEIDPHRPHENIQTIFSKIKQRISTVLELEIISPFPLTYCSRLYENTEWCQITRINFSKFSDVAFSQCHQLLHNILMFHEIFSEELFAHLIFERLINDIIIPLMKQEAYNIKVNVSRCQALADTLLSIPTRSWYLSSDVRQSELYEFSLPRFIVNLIKHLRLSATSSLESQQYIQVLSDIVCSFNQQQLL